MKVPKHVLTARSDLPCLCDCKTQSPIDRELREQLHAYRYLMFQHGLTIGEIAENEAVDERQIYASIAHCEVRLPKAEVLANRNFRNSMVVQRRTADLYVNTLVDLVEGKAGKNWTQRSRGLEHFRKTVGLDNAGAVSVNVTQQTVVGSPDRPTSFESMLTRVRAVLSSDVHSMETE